MPEEAKKEEVVDATSTNGSNGHLEIPGKAKDFTLDFEIFTRKKKKPDRRGIIYLAPEEVGLDRDEFDMGQNDRVAFVYDPLLATQDAEIREDLRDFEEPLFTD